MTENKKTRERMDNYNYPAGADTSDAPWNQENEVTLPFTVEYALEKRVIAGVKYFDKDGDGGYRLCDGLSDEEMEEVAGCGCMAPLDLIDGLVKLVGDLLHDFGRYATDSQIRRAASLTKEADGWDATSVCVYDITQILDSNYKHDRE